MKPHNPFPESPFKHLRPINYGNQWDMLKIVTELEEKTKPTTLLGEVILRAIKRGTPAARIFQLIKEQGENDRQAMCSCIGEDLYNKIVNFKM